MATEARTIYSHYDPIDRPALEKEVLRSLTEEQASESWRKESQNVYSRAKVPPPNFVPAKYDDSSFAGPSDITLTKSNTDSASWYRALTSKARNATPPLSDVPERPALAPTPSVSSEKTLEFKDETTPWFIKNVPREEKRSQSGGSLADLLLRSPPPLQSERKFAPRVWLALGPSNKGFGMLSRQGWNEGEALGEGIRRRQSSLTRRGKGKAKSEDVWVDESIVQETMEVQCGDDEDIVEVRKVDVVDLTLSESDSASDAEMEDVESDSNDGYQIPDSDNSPGSRKALITPLPVVLKTDRLGIGLNAKKTGPYRASQKRVTPNSAALAAHAKAAAELRRQKRTHGKGRRGFDRMYKAEEQKRKNMIAYLNA